MPPRYAYWTILVDDQPTAFRAGSQEDLMPTFKRLKEKHPSATMMWFQNGKLWPSRIDAQEAMRARGEMGRRGDERQVGGFRNRDHRPSRSEKPEWKPRGEFTPAPKGSDRPDWKPKTSRPQGLKTSEKLDWKPKGEFTPAPKRSERPDRKPQTFASKPFRSEKPEWKPKGSSDRDRKPEWKPKGSFDRDRKPEWTPRSKDARPRSSAQTGERKRPGEKLEWKPKSKDASSPETRSPEKRKWIPKDEYKKSQGIEAKRDSKWRPGGAHRDPRQKYKDAKKAKWSRFKKAIRTRSEARETKDAKRRKD
jgi:hypothetical protein